MTDLSMLGETKAATLRLLQKETRTAGDIAEALHIQVSAARKHLEQLASLSLVAESFQRQGVGRPRKFYALTEKGKELFPRGYDTLLNLLVAKLAERDGEGYAEQLLKAAAVDVARTFDVLSGNGEKRTDQAKAGINRLGFEASITGTNGHLTAISRNCPVWKVAVEQGEIVCRGFHGELLKAALKGRSVDRQEWMVDGDSYCKHTIQKT